VEMPLVKVLTDMETNGIAIDREALKESSILMTANLATMEAEIQELAGQPFNVNSPKQIGEVLFETLAIGGKAKKTKTGQYSTSEDVLETLKGKRIGLSRGQTSDEYLKMVLARRNMKYEDVQIVDIGSGSQTQLVTLLREGKADAVVCWEPFNTMVLEQVPDAYVAVRGGGHLSYIMVATTHEPTLQSDAQVIRNVVAGLAAASQYTRNNRDEAVDIFVKWVPGLDPAIGKKAIQHISYDPRVSAPVVRAFEAAQEDLLQNTVKGGKPLPIREQFALSILSEVQAAYPEYFRDLPALPAER